MISRQSAKERKFEKDVWVCFEMLTLFEAQHDSTIINYTNTMCYPAK